MKKFIILLMLVLLVGCTKVDETGKGDYEPGMYFGYDVVEGDRANVATAVVFVDENGLIADVFLDTTYMKGAIPHTKQALGEDYAMRPASEIEREWFEQANDLAAAVVENQELTFIEWTDADNDLTDSVSGVTMRVGSLYKAIERALEKAK